MFAHVLPLLCVQATSDSAGVMRIGAAAGQTCQQAVAVAAAAAAIHLQTLAQQAACWAALHSSNSSSGIRAVVVV